MIKESVSKLYPFANLEFWHCMRKLIVAIPLLGCYMIVVLMASCKNESYTDWQIYGGSETRIQYSSMTQIDTNNVESLQIAWVYHTKDAETSGQMEVNPIIAQGVMYGVSSKLKLFAIDPVSGNEKWIFDPFLDSLWIGKKKPGINICRGVSFYNDNGEKGNNLVFYTAGYLLYCINSNTGKPVTSFGNNGSVDLHDDLGRDVKDLYITSTSPGIIYKDLIIVGSAVSEAAAAAPGHIRAYDVHTGKLCWIFHTIPYPGEKGYETWKDKEAYRYLGGANSWAGFSLDEEKGLVFASTGSAAYDFYGGKRLGDNLFANSILALDASTGELRWHYQTVHHDVWDWDLPAAPVLVTITKEGMPIEAVVQVTKTGFIFVLDRETGQPVYPIDEKPVPTETDLDGEILSPTQPFPTFYKPFVRQVLNETDLFKNIPDSSYQDIRRRFSELKSGNLFNPPTKMPTIVFPGMQGGAEWGGPSFDPTSGVIYINANEIPRVLTMVNAREENPLLQQTNLEAGKILYETACMVCHGPDRKGGGDFPSIMDIDKKYTEAEFNNLLSSGLRRMPAFDQLNEAEKTALAAYLLNIESKQLKPFVTPPKAIDPYREIPYTHAGRRPSKFETKEGYPAIAPPWGSLSAINLNTGELLWKAPLGDYPELKARGIHTGTENYGGPVVTAGGLLFIAATKDEKFRAFNKKSGKLLWETDLPAAGFATPAVYEVNGKQHVVIACGGGKLKAKSGNAYVAFTLPDL